MRTTVEDAVRALVVRTDLAADEARTRLADAAERRVRALRDDGERGAQAVEYAMLGGVSAAACGTLVVVLKDENRLGGLVETILGWLGDLVTGWL